MPEPASPLLRGAGVSALAVALACLAHSVAGGVLPGPLVLAVLAVLTLPVTTAAARRPLTAPGTLALLGAVQLALHGAFGALAGHGSPAAGPGVVVTGAGTHHEHVGPLPTGAADALTSAAGAAGGTGTTSAVPADLLHAVTDTAGAAHLTGVPMLLAHVVATVLTALLLATADAATRRAAAWWAARRPDAGDLPVPALPAPAVPPRAALATPRRTVLPGAVGRRGPPRGLALPATA